MVASGPRRKVPNGMEVLGEGMWSTAEEELEARLERGLRWKSFWDEEEAVVQSQKSKKPGGTGSIPVAGRKGARGRTKAMDFYW